MAEEHIYMFMLNYVSKLVVRAYLMLMFGQLIILLNVLTAQVSKTYSAVQSTARASTVYITAASS